MFDNGNEQGFDELLEFEKFGIIGKYSPCDLLM